MWLRPTVRGGGHGRRRRGAAGPRAWARSQRARPRAATDKCEEHCRAHGHHPCTPTCIHLHSAPLPAVHLRFPAFFFGLRPSSDARLAWPAPEERAASSVTCVPPRKSSRTGRRTRTVMARPISRRTTRIRGEGCSDTENLQLSRAACCTAPDLRRAGVVERGARRYAGVARKPFGYVGVSMRSASKRLQPVARREP